jgi:hypothetical protein
VVDPAINNAWRGRQTVDLQFSGSGINQKKILRGAPDRGPGLWGMAEDCEPRIR